MKEALTALQDLWTSLLGLGFDPWIIIIALCGAIGGNLVFTPSMYDVTKPEEKAIYQRRKNYVLLSTWALTTLAQLFRVSDVMLNRPITPQPLLYKLPMALVMGFVFSIIGQVAYSYLMGTKYGDILKEKYGVKASIDTTPDPNKP